MSLEPPTLCRFLIAAAAPLVPADRRADWKREWRMEAAWSAARSRMPGWRLALRCLGAFAHAAWLRWDRWRSDMLMQDVRFALRSLSRRPLFAAVTVLTLALGIGASAAMFGAVRAVLLRPLPFPEPDRLVQVFTTAAQGVRVQGSTSPPDFVDWRRDGRSFRSMAALESGAYALTGGGVAEQVPGANVTGSFFDVMGVRPLHGRALAAEDDAPGGPSVVVLGHSLWVRRFGADPAVVGRRIQVDGEVLEVVGVMPAGFALPTASELWLPLRFSAEELATQRGAHYLDVLARLAPGATVDSAQAEMRTIAGRLAAAYPRTNRDYTATIDPLRDALVGDVRTPLLVLMGAVGFVLLMVCVNVAGLALAQATARLPDLAVRRALGAGPGRLLSALLTESLLLGLGGGALGLLLATWATGVIAALGVTLGIELLEHARVDATVVAFTTLLSIAAAAIVGALPAWQAASIRDLASGLRGRGPSVAADRRRAGARLIVAETAVASMLLVGAGLLTRSFAHLRSVDLGFRTDGIQTFAVSMPEAAYGQPEQRAAFVEGLLSRLATRPEVESAGAIFGLPLTDFWYVISTSELDGRALDDREQDRLSVQLRAVTPDYFRTMGIGLERGRAFGPDDRRGAPCVAIVSESAAALLWPGQEPIGHRIALGTRLGQGQDRAGGQVVGVVSDVLHVGPAKGSKPTVYVAHAQFPVDFVTVAVRAREGALPPVASLRSDLAALAPDVPMFQVRTMEQIASGVTARPRLYMLVLLAFATTAVALAALGLYGVLAQAVGQRTREIGIRMAIGAARREVVLLVMAQGGRLALMGILAGLGASVLASRALSGLLFGVAPLDLPTYAAVGLALLAIALFASWLPARRAARVDPVRALRAD